MNFKEREDFRRAVDGLLTKASDAFRSCPDDFTRSQVVTLLKSLELQAGALFEQMHSIHKHTRKNAKAKALAEKLMRL